MSTEDTIEVAPAAATPLSRLEINVRRGDTAFRAARSRSRMVRMLKLVLPALAGAGILAFGITVLKFRGETGGLSMDNIDLKAGSLVMEAPRVSGFDATKKSYDIRADRAIQNLDDPKKVHLEGIGARLGLDSRNSATLEAKDGIYDTAAETLVLSGGIAITMSSGYRADLSRARIDLKNGSMVTKQPVKLTSAEGSISANEVEITERGRLIRFRRGVQVTLIPPDDAAAAPAEASSQPVETKSSEQ